MANYAVIDKDGAIVNIIVLDDPSAWTFPEGHSIVEDVGICFAIGGTILNGRFSPPPPPPASKPPAHEVTPRQLIKALAPALKLSDQDAEDLLNRASAL